MPTFQCPTCSGSGRVRWLKGRNPDTGELEYTEGPCHRCGGSGTITR